MARQAAGTNGGAGGTTGTRRRALLLFAAGFALILALVAMRNAESRIADLAAAGVQETPTHVWTWELSSLLAWVTVMPAIWWAVAQVRPPRFGWPATLVILALLTVPASLWHVAVMVGLRKIVYGLEGLPYHFFGSSGGELLYEYRKDFVTFLQFAATAWFAQWLLLRFPERNPARPGVLEVSDGPITHHVPIDEIEHVAAAGNYVEIMWGRSAPQTLLHRATMASISSDLGEEFARIHRSRLVRRSAILRIETERSGDFIVELRSGALLRGSRRYRGSLKAMSDHGAL